MRIFLTVIDSFGVGEMPDAHEFGDKGSNTYLNIVKATGLTLPTLESFGLNNIDGINLPTTQKLIGSYGKMSEITKAKDTLAGHYEMSGIILEKPYPTFPNAFPKKFVEELEEYCGVKFLSNEVASGTEIIQRLGEKHKLTNRPILYTSQDSVLQIAAHEKTFGLEKLYEVCERARKFCSSDSQFNIARVIARPFIDDGEKFIRTENRKDYALAPTQPTMLDKLKTFGYDVIAIGKIKDIFCGQGITKSITAKTNEQGLLAIEQMIEENFNGLVFTNLVETDMLYGHRNDYKGYAEALRKIDESFARFLPKLSDEDIFIVTGDHGCDPTTESTDHSREYVPLLIYSKNLKAGVNLGTLKGFDNIAKSILDYAYVEKYENSFFKKLQI